jgi:ElaB/YqjD/DUF883 family membrane-anchored ribosome-binding protein
MAKKKSVRAELGDLQSQLKHAEAPKANHAEPPPRHETDRIFAELESGLTKAGEEAEELVAAHPLAAVAAAFLLGLVAGRILGR